MDDTQHAGATPDTTPDVTQDTANGGVGDYARLPDDHPVVTALERQKEKAARKDAEHAREVAELREKAEELDRIKEANKSDAEKAAEKAAKAQRQLDEMPARIAEALKKHLVKLHGISDDDAEDLLTATDPDKLLRQVERLVGKGDGSRFGVVPRQGTATPANVRGSSYELGVQRAQARLNNTPTP